MNPAPANAKWERVIAHADMDAFYASVEVLDNPALRGLPVIVGGRSNRGVVTSASYEARKFGVRSAMPTVQARKLCPDGVFVPGRMHRYVEISRAVRIVFESFSPAVEPLSLDEAFLDLTGTERLLGAPLEVGRALRRRIAEQTGLVVSVGIAPNKMTAKILSDLCKPDGLLESRPGVPARVSLAPAGRKAVGRGPRDARADAPGRNSHRRRAGGARTGVAARCVRLHGDASVGARQRYR